MTIYAHSSIFELEKSFPRPRNHGNSWTMEEVAQLVQAFLSRQPVLTTAQILGRSAYSVCLKLLSRRYLTRLADGTFLYSLVCKESSSSIRKEIREECESFSKIYPIGESYKHLATELAMTAELFKQKEKYMKTLQQQTLILGNDLSKANADSCLQLIGQLQKKRKELSELGIDSSYVKKELEECNEAVKLVIKQLDSLNG